MYTIITTIIYYIYYSVYIYIYTLYIHYFPSNLYKYHFESMWTLPSTYPLYEWIIIYLTKPILLDI